VPLAFTPANEILKEEDDALIIIDDDMFDGRGRVLVGGENSLTHSAPPPTLLPNKDDNNTREENDEAAVIATAISSFKRRFLNCLIYISIIRTSEGLCKINHSIQSTRVVNNIPQFVAPAEVRMMSFI
jgi:hypothetical protein